MLEDLGGALGLVGSESNDQGATAERLASKMGWSQSWGLMVGACWGSWLIVYTDVWEVYGLMFRMYDAPNEQLQKQSNCSPWISMAIN